MGFWGKKEGICEGKRGLWEKNEDFGERKGDFGSKNADLGRKMTIWAGKIRILGAKNVDFTWKDEGFFKETTGDFCGEESKTREDASL